LWEAARKGAGAGGKANASLRAFVELIESMRAATAGLPLPEVVDHVNSASGLVAHYKGEKDGQDRLDNLAELVTRRRVFFARPTSRSMRPSRCRIGRRDAGRRRRRHGSAYRVPRARGARSR
jgi:superfamily I DNA/RNA helicase